MPLKVLSADIHQLFHGYHKAGKVTPFKHSEAAMPAPALTGPQYLRENRRSDEML